MEYAIVHNIVLRIHEQNDNGDYPILWCSIKDNIEMAKLLMDYVTMNNTILVT